MNKFADNTTCLVADIGGTNTRVALAEGSNLIPETISKYKNAKHSSLNEVLEKFIREQGNVDCAAACVAVAGPVRDGVGALTNLDWAIDRDTLRSATRAENVAILNDLQAQGHALGHLDPKSIVQVIDVNTGGAHSAELVVGIGTGFNAAVVFNGEAERLVPPSECGHANVPMRQAEDMEICRFIARDRVFPSIDDVLSGRGLEWIYQWVCDSAGQPERLSAADIMGHVGAGTNANATLAANHFTRILGNVVGDLALIHLPFGGVNLVGGVARAFAPYLETFGFQAAFRDKGRFQDFMGEFSVSVIQDDWAALIGSAHHMANVVNHVRN